MNTKNKIAHYRPYIILFTLLVICCFPGTDLCASSGNIKLTKLTCDHVQDPFGMGNKNPILGWQIQSDKNGTYQKSYRIIVASEKSILEENRGDLWDSGMVTSAQSQNIPYTGIPLISLSDYYWKVKIWTDKGEETEWSPVAYWKTALFDEKDWKGDWISRKYEELIPHRVSRITHEERNKEWYREDSAAVYMRREVEITDPVKMATAFISGLGFYELYINGRKVGDRVLDPVFTDFDKRVVYASYDVTDYLKHGQNALGIILGNGWYSSPTIDAFRMHVVNWKTSPKVRANIVVEYQSGRKETIVTDRNWKWSNGEILFNSVRSGETIDHTKTQEGWNMVSFDDNSWQNVVKVPAPLGKLSTDAIPPIRVVQQFKALSITEPEEGVYLIDFGENMTGWVEARIHGTAGQVVDIDHNEVLLPNGTLNTQNSIGHTYGRYQHETYILNGKGQEIFEPRFTYHGFRYIQVKGLTYKPSADDFVAKSVHTDMPSHGNFNCSMTALNNLNSAVRRTLLNCVHGMPGEEPTREKMGWTLDAAVVMDSYLYNFDAVTTYKKSLMDFIEAQLPTGHIPAVVPCSGWGYVSYEGHIQFFDDPWWGGSIFLLVDKLYNYTGDIGILETAFPALKAYVDYMGSTANNYIVSWSIGDWLDLNPDITSQASYLTPVAQTSTVAYFWMSSKVAEYARLLGYDKRLSDTYSSLSSVIRDKYNEKFLDYETGLYAENSQTAQALPLLYGIVPENMKEKVERRLLDAISLRDGHVSAGFIGANFMMDYLPQNGHFDIAFKMLTQPESPGWLHMAKNEKSTMSESVNAHGPGSGHHPYGAHIGFWLNKYIGGIRPDETKPGYQHFIIEPGITSRLEEASTNLNTLYGEITSSWKKTSDGLSVTIIVPPNTTAKFIVPSGIVTNKTTVNGMKPGKVKYVSTDMEKDNKRYYSVQSGSYTFFFE